MDDLIRKQTVLNMIDDVQFGNITNKLSQLHEAVRNYPSVDAVEVIRCKDCKHCMIFSMFTSKWYVCCRNEKGVDVKAEDFCSKAERGKNERD